MKTRRAAQYSNQRDSRAKGNWIEDPNCNVPLSSRPMFPGDFAASFSDSFQCCVMSAG
jgi:hypothetical protein